MQYNEPEDFVITNLSIISIIFAIAFKVFEIFLFFCNYRSSMDSEIFLGLAHRLKNRFGRQAYGFETNNNLVKIINFQ